MTSSLPSAAVPIQEDGARMRAGVSKDVAQDLVSGTSALGIALMIERGFGFLANVLAARLGGVATFGAYSLAITTANNVSTYAAGGIGSTAIRFSGQHPRGTAGYGTLSRVLLIVSLISAAVAALALTAGAAPVAHLLGKPGLTTLLQWTGLSAAGMILLECCRGFLVGQRRLAAIVAMSSIVGLGMVIGLPIASRVGATAMIISQGGIVLGAVIVCLLFRRQLGLSTPKGAAQSEPIGPMLREVWSFGLMQLAGLIGMNAAGWWLTSLVARADTSMVQMGFFAVSHQLRNMAALAPSLLTESGLAVMAQGEHDAEKTPDQVMAICTFAATIGSLLLAGLGIIVAPWGLALVYGHSYAAAAPATAIALATAVVHMGSAPAAARLSILSIKISGVVNTIWAVLVGVAGTVFLFHAGSASKAASIYLGAHLFSAVVVLFFLTHWRSVPNGMNPVFFIGTVVSLALAALALLRDQYVAVMLPVTLSMMIIYVAGAFVLLRMGSRRGWVPSVNTLQTFLKSRLAFFSKAAQSTAPERFDV